ncbi:MAG: DUF4199 domain-containing protein [Verrucomicrobia bacterium]|nr:DUF4199 domain-containing protein [Verrucomicrobiota bacterium]
MRAELKYGLVAGLLMSAWMLVEHVFGVHTVHLGAARYTGIVGDLIPAVMLYLLLKHQIAALQRYWLPLWEGMLYGFAASLAAALVFYIFLNAYKFFLNPGWVDLQLEWTVAQMRAAGVAESLIQEKVVAQRAAFSPVGLALTIPVFVLAGGAVSALITLWLNWRHKETAHVG